MDIATFLVIMGLLITYKSKKIVSIDERRRHVRKNNKSEKNE
jgi:hypothetical protein